MKVLQLKIWKENPKRYNSETAEFETELQN